MAGAEPVGLIPKRRTAFTFDSPAGLDLTRMPMVIDFDELVHQARGRAVPWVRSPTRRPRRRCDAQPEEIDVATAVERIETATTLSIRRIKNK